MVFVFLFLLSFTKPLLGLAAEKGSVPLSTVLPAKHTDFIKLSFLTGLAPMHIAVGNTELLEDSGNYSVPDAHQKEPIFFGTWSICCWKRMERLPLKATTTGLPCAEHSFLEVAANVLDHSTFVDAQDSQGRHTLHFAVENDHGDMHRFVISCRCDHSGGRKGAEVAPKPLKKELINLVVAILMQRSRGIQLSS